MAILILGLLIFLGVHSIRIFASGWRVEQIARMGEQRWKAVYSMLSLTGFLLIVWGFGLARAAPVTLWLPPAWTRHLAALVTLVAFVLLVAAYVPGTRIKAAVGHPMIAATKIWGLAHLVANGTLADAVLFGSFMTWAVVAFAAARRRDRAAGMRYSAIGIGRDVLAVGIGIIAWFLFARFGHVWLIGMKPYA